MKHLRRAAVVLTLLLALAWGGASTYLYLKQGSIIYLPTRELAKTPKVAGLPYEDLRLPVQRANGASETISAWWLPAPQPNGLSILFLHGNARNMGTNSNVEKITGLARAGFNVLTLDYRSYGRSDGDVPYEAALYEDADAAFTEFSRRAPDPAKRILHGHSMGGAVAIDLGARRPREFAAGFIEASFTTMTDMSTLNPLYRVLPIDTLLTERFESARKIARFTLPVLFIHGTSDTRIPHAMSRQLYALAPEPKAVVLIEGANHNNLHGYSQYGSAYRLLLDMAKK